MRNSDFDEFAAALDSACTLLSKGGYRPNGTSTALFFKLLSRYELWEVLAALEAHCLDEQRGKFPPVPADIVHQIDSVKADDGRPADAEAWATALRANDERNTVVWTDETAEASGVCRPVLEAGDEVGARMAFKSAYARLVGAARAAREPVRWSPSIGHDAAQRDDVLRLAVDAGRLPVAYLPGPLGPVAGLLELSRVRGIPESVRNKLHEIRSQISGRDAGPSDDLLAKEQTASAKEIVADAVRRYQGGGNE
jgi:hypothetical protein